MRLPLTTLTLLTASAACQSYAGGAPHADEPNDEPPPMSEAPPSEDAPVAMEQTWPMPDSQVTTGALPPQTGTELHSTLRFARTPRFDGYLVDAEGRALYMFAEDVAGASESACLDACASEWPPFDLREVITGPGVEASEVSRFHRQDGAWQATYKGFPLYYRAGEEGSRAVGGDGLRGRWFVARDYLAFIAARDAANGALPLGVTSYLTDGFGRTLYVCLDDRPRSATSAPRSSCVGMCSVDRPPWSAAATQRSSALPSTLLVSALGSFVREDGIVQLTYHGLPLYHFRGDLQLGESVGHNQRAWRALDPSALRTTNPQQTTGEEP